MARFNAKKIKYDEQEIIWDKFCKVVASLGTSEKIKDFLKDLLNRGERMMLARRLEIAKLLSEEKTYRAIKKELRVGIATIARVDRWLHFGRNGYFAAIKEMKKARS